MGTLVILNPNAGSGRAGRIWQRIQPLLITALGEIEVAITQRWQDVETAVAKAATEGISRVIAIGGDGTSHVVINALLNTPTSTPFTFGQIPLGTGQDFARAMGIPGQPEAAVQWLVQSQPQPLDVGCIEYDGESRYFLNIASVGLGGEVDQRINQIRQRRPWSFLTITLQTFFSYTPPLIRVRLDGKDWYEGTIWSLAVANGTTFGRGMKIAPHASVKDGLFDVVLSKGMPRLAALRGFANVYSGQHLDHPGVLFQRASTVEVEAPQEVLPLDLDGEYASGRKLRFTVKPAAIQFMTGPSS